MASSRPVLAVVLACVLSCLVAGCDTDTPRKIVLIGGAKSEGPARHDYPNGVLLLKGILESSPDAPRKLTIEAYPDGWPKDSAALDGASTIVWYFDGLEKHPLIDAVRRARFEALMQRGVGLVVLHQASTVLPDDDMNLPRWLGAARYGMFDRTTESAEIAPATPAHPVSRGIAAFTYRDEFYPSFRFRSGGKGIVPILQTTLHVQYRDGAHLVADTPQTSNVAWTFERDTGGRAFGFSGAHYLETLDEPNVRKMLLNAIFWTAGIEVPEGGVRSGLGDGASVLARKATDASSRKVVEAAAQADMPAFHNDPGRGGWRSREMVLTPENVAGPSFGLAWESPQFDVVDGQPPRLYASPLYVDRVRISAGQHRGATFSVVFAATSNGFVYAVNAVRAGDVAPGRTLWRARLGAPCRLQPAPLDGIPTGILSTPVIDVARERLYVTHCDPDKRWQAYALDMTSGEVLPGWPVRLDEATFNALNRNAGPSRVALTRRFDFRVQRGALNLSPDGSLLYVVFGETETGWLVAVDTVKAEVKSAFASVAMPHRGSGGIWGAGGPAIDAQGNVFVVTGTGFDGYADRPHDWTQSVLMFSQPGPEGFVLRGTYTPFNYCQTAKMDIDLGSGGAVLLPDRDPATTATPQLMAVGGKQGNVYLLDRSRLPGRLDRRQPCGHDSSQDASLLPPQNQPQFGKRGPLNAFGPYSEQDAAMDLARARSVPAHFRDVRGVDYLFVTGNSKLKEGSPVGVPPSIARIEIVAKPSRPAYLRIDRTQRTLVLENPGSPVVTSDGARNAMLWILDENASRSAPLVGPDAPQPVLYALDATTLDVLWKSVPGELFTSGKYNEPAFGRGKVFVGTDRIQAFGLSDRKFAARQAEERRVAEVTGALSKGRSPPATFGADPGGIDGMTIYLQRCAICHDRPQGNVPPRRLIARRSHDQLVEVLTRGAMRAQAQGLSAQQIDSVARYLK